MLRDQKTVSIRGRALPGSLACPKIINVAAFMVIPTKSRSSSQENWTLKALSLITATSQASALFSMTHSIIQYINEVVSFQTSAENLSKHFYDWCKREWPQTVAARVSETGKTWAAYPCMLPVS
jgi:hypothetical protein